MCALNETKLKGKGGAMFGEVVGRVSGMQGGRAMEGVALLLSGWLLRCVLKWKEVSSMLMWAQQELVVGNCRFMKKMCINTHC